MIEDTDTIVMCIEALREKGCLTRWREAAWRISQLFDAALCAICRDIKILQSVAVALPYGQKRRSREDEAARLQALSRGETVYRSLHHCPAGRSWRSTKYIGCAQCRWLKQQREEVRRQRSAEQPNNLRDATRRSNSANVGLPSNNTSGHKGVHWHKSRKKWCAQMRVDGNRVHLGCFDKIEYAAAAYERAAEKYQGEFAYHISQQRAA